MIRHLLPSTGSRWNLFPCFTGTMKCSDALRPSRRASFPSLGATLRCVRCFRSRWSRTPDHGPGVHCAGPHRRLLHAGRRSGPPRFLGNPGVPMPCSLTPAGPTTPGHCGASTRPPLTRRRRLPHFFNFGAQSHGFGTCCLRFARWVTRTGRKTRCWLLAKLYQAGLDTRRVPAKGFCDASYIASSLPKLSWRSSCSFSRERP